MLPVRHASAFHAAKVQLFSSTARFLVIFFQMRPSGRLLWFLGLEVGGWFFVACRGAAVGRDLRLREVASERRGGGQHGGTPLG